MRNDTAARAGSTGQRNAAQRNHRGVALTVLDGRGGVQVSTKTHPRNHAGEGFTVLATKHEDDPAPGGDGIMRAVEEAWIGEKGYAKGDFADSFEHRWQRRALAFLGEVTTKEGAKIMELFVLDLPDDPSALREASGPAAGLGCYNCMHPIQLPHSA
jgi:hypothetical protein